MTDRKPDLVGRLSGQSVEMECGEQADRTIGHALGGLRKRPVLAVTSTDGDVQAVADPLQLSSVRKPGEVGAGNTRSLKVSGTDNADLSCQRENVVCVYLCHGPIVLEVSALVNKCRHMDD